MDTPRGIIVAGAVEVLLGIFALIGGVLHLLFGVGGLVSFSGTDVTLGALANGLGDLFTIEGLILLVAGFGLWRGKMWGWRASIGVIIAGILTSIPVLILGSVGAVPALLVNLILLYYLTRKHIREFFRTGASLFKDYVAAKPSST